MVSDNLAMRRPGTQFTRDGVNLSWPLGGEREVIHLPMDDRPATLKRRIAEGHIVETDDAPTTHIEETPRVYKILTGDEAREHKAIPAGPVTRFIFQRDDGSSARANVQMPRVNEEAARSAYEEGLTTDLDDDDEEQDASDSEPRKIEPDLPSPEEQAAAEAKQAEAAKAAEAEAAKTAGAEAKRAQEAKPAPALVAAKPEAAAKPKASAKETQVARKRTSNRQ